MRKICCMGALLLVGAMCVADSSLGVSASGARKHRKIKSLMLCHDPDSLMLKCAKVIYDDLDFSDQFDVVWQKTDAKPDSVSLKKLFSQGTSLLIAFFKQGKLQMSVSVKDTSSGMVLFNKSVSIEPDDVVRSGHTLASDMLEALTGDRGVCLSTLAFCKAVSPRHKVICTSDYSCKQVSVAVPAKTINLVPRWHTSAPVLFYSQLTKKNNRLMSFDFCNKKHKVVCSYSGLNMQPGFSPDGTQAVLCLSGGKGNSELYLYDIRVCNKLGRRVFKQLTSNGAHNVSPAILRDGNIVFCSNFKTGMPQLYHRDKKTGVTTQLTNGKGYAASPSYCAQTNTLAYTRPVRGTFQLFVLSLDDLECLEEQQVTFGAGNKHEPCWSRNGRYLMFSFDYPDKKGRRIPQIAALNYLNYRTDLNCRNKKIRVLTSGLAPKSFPHWTDRCLW